MATVITNIPKLRFSDFNTAWGSGEIGNVAKIKHGYAFKSEFFTDLGPYVVLTPGNFQLGGGFRYQGDKEKYYSDSNIPKDYILRRGDLVTAMTEQAVGLIGSPLIVPEDEKFLHNQRLGLFQLVEEAEQGFLYFSMQTSSMRRDFSNSAAGSKVRHTSPKRIENLQWNFPTLPEQKKIADFLTSVDERIGQLIKKKALLEDYKKGVMQQLFSQQIRFKDDNGNDFPDWEENEFLEVMKTVSPRGHQIESSAILPEGVFRVIDQGKVKVAGYCNDPNRVMADIPVIVFGDHTTTIKYIDFEFVVGADGTKILTSKSAEHELKYFYYNLVHNNVPQEGYKRHFSILKEISLQVPSNDEQKKIADFLSAIDQKIESVSQQIAKTQTFKKGLLQQMFV